LDNEPLYLEEDEPELGAYVITDDQEELIISLSASINDGLWTMQFDGARSRFKSGTGIVLTAPSRMVFPFSFCLEFDWTNNMAVYDALLLGLQRARKMGIKQLKVEGDSKLDVNQVKMQCKARNPRLKRYRDAVWGEMDCFNAFNIIVVPCMFNKLVDSMASATTLFQPCTPNPYIKYMVEVSFQSFIPIISVHGKFLRMIDRFVIFKIALMSFLVM
jgi:hypothetical protein